MSIHRQPQNEITERMKTMKKILSGFLLLLMLVSVLGIPAGAADAPDVMTAGVSVDEETGAVSLTLTAAQDTVSGRITVAYDSGLLSYADVEMTGAVSSVGQNAGSVVFGYASPAGDAIAEGSVIAVVHFTSNRKWNYTPLTVTVEDFNGQEGIHISLPVVEVGNAQMPFTDVAEDQWYYEAVKYVYAQGLFKGMTETRFAPNHHMSRAMFITVLGRMAGVEEDRNATTAFTDVKSGSYYAGYVAWAAENEIVMGTSETTFSPNSDVTREQMVTFLYRFADYLGRNTEADEEALNQFPDASSVSGWARAAMAWATDRGILIGTEKGLSPKNPATRGQCAQIWMNFNLCQD